MTPANVPFTEADLASQVLWMCLHQWQDQYNLQEKDMTPMDMHSLQAPLKAIEHMCTPEKAHAQSGKKVSQKSKAGTKRPSTGATKQIYKKVRFMKFCELSKKHGGAHTTHTTKDCCRYKKYGMVKANFCTTNKAGKKPNPAKQSLPSQARNWTSWRRLFRKLLLSLRNAAGTIEILIANRK
jgi:hypothetical protein